MSTLTIYDILGRLLLSFLIGALIGLERESHGRPAGLRTTILVCTASTLAMILSEQLFLGSAPENISWRPDPARLAAGILSGMGFLGAGTIIRQENIVRGVTTAASLWFSSILGLSIGCGFIQLSLVGAVIICMTLFLLPRMDQWIQIDYYAEITLVLHDTGPSEELICKKLQDYGISIKNMDLEADVLHKKKTLHYSVKLKKKFMRELSSKVVDSLSHLPEVQLVKWT